MKGIIMIFTIETFITGIIIGAVATKILIESAINE